MKMLKNKKGQGLVEYALLVAIIAAVVVVANVPLTNAANAAWLRVTNAIAG